MNIIITIILIALLITLCMCIYKLGKVDGIYKMQLISLYIIDNMADNFLNNIKESPNLNISDDQYGLVHVYMIKEVFKAIDSIPDIDAVNSTFKTITKEEEKQYGNLCRR